MFAKHALFLLVLATLFGGVNAQNLPKVQAGLEAVGTFSWITFAIDHYDLDTHNGFELETTTYATKQAKELALRSGESDLVVDDFLGPVRWAAQGMNVKGVYPYSLATGGVIVSSEGGINSVTDLKGKTIMASSRRDKTLLLLRALALAEHGFDPQLDSEVLEGAPPLMINGIASGEVDAVIPFWHIAARLTATGENTELIAATTMLTELGLDPNFPLLMLVARDEMNRDLLAAFITAMQEAITMMQADDEIWDLILENELYSLPDESQFPSVVAKWSEGVPSVWDQAVVDGMISVVEKMVAIAGAEVVGVDAVSPEAYSLEFATP